MRPEGESSEEGTGNLKTVASGSAGEDAEAMSPISNRATSSVNKDDDSVKDQALAIATEKAIAEANEQSVALQMEMFGRIMRKTTDAINLLVRQVSIPSSSAIHICLWYLLSDILIPRSWPRVAQLVMDHSRRRRRGEQMGCRGYNRGKLVRHRAPCHLHWGPVICPPTICFLTLLRVQTNDVVCALSVRHNLFSCLYPMSGPPIRPPLHMCALQASFISIDLQC